MPCDPSNQSHNCCKGMVSSQSPDVLPVAYVTLHALVMVVTNVLASPQTTPYAEVSRLDFEAPQHSPPGAVHASFFPPDLIRFSAVRQRTGLSLVVPLLFL